MQLQQQLDKNADEETRLNTLKQFLNRELLSSEKACKESETAFEEAKQLLKDREKDGLTQVTSWRSDLDKVQSSASSLVALSKKLAVANLPGINRELESVQSSIQAKEDKIQELNPKIQTTNSEVTSSERAKRNVVDNLAVRDLSRDMSSLQQKIREKQTQGGGNRTQYR